MLGHFERDIEQNQKTLCAPRWPKGRNCNISGTAKGIKLRLSLHIEGMWN
jgi:hypothetical protein